MAMMKIVLLITTMATTSVVFGLPSETVLKQVSRVNALGHHLGIVIPTAYEMSPFIDESIFQSYSRVPTIDIGGRRFHIGAVGSHRVIVVSTGASMLNSGITTQLLLDFFRIKGVVHYGIAGNANDELNIGDIAIPKYWAHAGLWNWQKYGEGVNDSLPFEDYGDSTRSIGHLHIGDYNNPTDKRDNLLNNIWFQPEEVFPVTGTPEVREHYFWVPVSSKYLKIAEKIEDIPLVSCVNATSCLNKAPKLVIVERGISANVYVDNSAYRSFIHKKFDVSPVDMESAAVALVCLTNDVPFIVFRAVSNLAGVAYDSDQDDVFFSLAPTNAVTVIANFIKLI